MKLISPISLFSLISILIAACSPAATPEPPTAAPPTHTAAPPTATSLPPTDTPPPLPTEAPTAEPTPALEVLPAEPFKVEFLTVDGFLVSGLYYPAARNPAPTALFFNQFGIDQKQWDAMARWLQNRGSAAASGGGLFKPVRNNLPPLPEDISMNVFTHNSPELMGPWSPYSAYAVQVIGFASTDSASGLATPIIKHAGLDAALAQNTRKNAKAIDDWMKKVDEAIDNVLLAGELPIPAGAFGFVNKKPVDREEYKKILLLYYQSKIIPIKNLPAVNGKFITLGSSVGADQALYACLAKNCAAAVAFSPGGYVDMPTQVIVDGLVKEKKDVLCMESKAETKGGCDPADKYDIYKRTVDKGHGHLSFQEDEPQFLNIACEIARIAKVIANNTPNNAQPSNAIPGCVN